MKYEIVYNKVLRLSLSDGAELVQDFLKNEKATFAEQQQLMDLLAHKNNAIMSFPREYIDEAIMSLALMSKDQGELGHLALDNLKKYPLVVWMETIPVMDKQSIIRVLCHYYKEFPSSIIEIFIINLSDEKQSETIKKYKDYLDFESETFYSFYLAVGPIAKETLKEIKPSLGENDFELELNDVNASELDEILKTKKEKLLELPISKLIEIVLIKSTTTKTFDTFFDLYMNEIEECDDYLFKLLFTRYKYEKWLKKDDKELYSLFYNKLHKIGLLETLKLFNNKSYDFYSVDDFVCNLILDFIDDAIDDKEINSYINEPTKKEIIRKFVEKCNSKQYSLEEFEKLVKKIRTSEKEKLINDDYIEAIIACGQLLKRNIINDKNELFIELRNKFTDTLINKVSKDGTFNEKVSLNGLFYRLAKGNVPFEKVLMTKTYKGLIYLTKSGDLNLNPDNITQYLSDEQLAKMNILPVLKMKKSLSRTNSAIDSESLVERLCLQLYCFFGKDRAKYLLESKLQGRRMENLFDGLNYKDIKIDEFGNPIINKELGNFLFGGSSMKEPNSAINKMINGEIPLFEKCFTDFCNDYQRIKEQCNGIVTIKRVIKQLTDSKLPIKLNPDEIEFKQALFETGSKNPDILKSAIALCKDARNRTYSTIPKVKGSIGDFTYEILDIKDPMAVASGYLSHCCFVINGISYSALKQSMQSENGRIFVVYRNGIFLAHSWVWRNGDVVCFDSVEEGSIVQRRNKDGIGLVDVYKEAARKILDISDNTEDKRQSIKVVTVGSSNDSFNILEKVSGKVPRPLEKDVYAYDSMIQRILSGSMPKNVRYGPVGAQYKDERKPVIFIGDITKADIDKLDDSETSISSLRYQINNIEEAVDYGKYSKVIVGDGWYILIDKENNIESGSLDDPDCEKEYKHYLSKFDDKVELKEEDNKVKRLVRNKKGDA